MKKPNNIIRTLVGLIAAALTTTVWGLGIDRAITEFDIVPPDPATPSSQLNLRARLSETDLRDVSSSKFVVMLDAGGPPTRSINTHPVRTQDPGGLL